MPKFCVITGTYWLLCFPHSPAQGCQGHVIRSCSLKWMMALPAEIPDWRLSMPRVAWQPSSPSRSLHNGSTGSDYAGILPEGAHLGKVPAVECSRMAVRPSKHLKDRCWGAAYAITGRCCMVLFRLTTNPCQEAAVYGNVMMM